SLKGSSRHGSSRGAYKLGGSLPPDEINLLSRSNSIAVSLNRGTPQLTRATRHQSAAGTRSAAPKTGCDLRPPGRLPADDPRAVTSLPARPDATHRHLHSAKDLPPSFFDQRLLMKR